MKIKSYIIRLICGLLIGLAFSTQTAAQPYKNAIGLRFGSITGVTVKHFFKENSAWEAIFSSRHQGWMLNGLYEKYAQAFNVTGLSWFYGAGAHAGMVKGCSYRNFIDEMPGEEYVFSGGIDGIVGLEYFIADIPFAISADIKPMLDVRCPRASGMDAALSVRYTF